jgi:hypothetical protein
MTTLQSAARLIDRQGIVLVFPIQNRSEPKSLWSLLHPRSRMLWQWDNEGDHRVADLWHLREELARSRRVVYTKWFQGRATFFSKKVFSALLAELQSVPLPLDPPEAQQLLGILEENSPLSTKQLKHASALQGRPLEGIYQRALKELWSRLLIVGVGEIDDGAFPSLSIGATRWMFEDLWQVSLQLGEDPRRATLERALSESPSFRRYYQRLKRNL